MTKMLRILHNFHNLDFSQFTNVYHETIELAAVRDGRTAAEQAFYEDLSLFLTNRDAVCCVWECGGKYTSCVRYEPYMDGTLLTCLETSPQNRRKGYARSLVKALLDLAIEQKQLPVYVHIHKNNKASIALHKGLGFRKIADYAHLVDGTVSTSYFTLKFE